MNARQHKTLTYLQVSYDARTDTQGSFEEGLERLDAEGWELVTSYAGLPGTWCFVFRKRLARGS